MATESLIVELDARTSKLDAKLQKTQKQLDDLDDKVKKTDESIISLGKSAKFVGGVAVKLASAYMAVSAAVQAMVLNSAKGRHELEQLSRQAKMTTEDFQGLAFAAKSYGINAEQIADISKDISDRLGEFATAGTGTFQDYADVMKLTKQEARELASEWQHLSSEQVIGRMIENMESAGATGAQMTFVLESMGNDLSKLTPLFTNNSKALKTLKDRYDAANKSMQITSGQAEELKAVSTSYDLLIEQVGNAATAISATIAPVVDSFFNDVINIVPDATQTIIDFANSFLDAENITSQSAVLKQITESQARIVEFEAEREKIASQNTTYMKDGGHFQNIQLKQLDGAIQAEKDRTAELNAQLEVLEAQKLQLEDAKRLQGGDITGEGGDPTVPLGTGDQIQAIADRFKTEEELLQEKLDRELEIVGDNKELRLALEDEFIENALAIDDKYREETEKREADGLAKRAQLQAKAAKARIGLEKSVANNVVSLIGIIGGESKAAALAALVIQKAQALSANATATASGATLAYASQLVPGDPTSPARAAAAAAHVKALGAVNAGLIVATGLGQAAAIASDGGGSSFGGGGSDFGDGNSAQQDFEPETSSIEVSETTDTSRTQRLVISLEDGTDLMDGIASALDENNRQGR